MKVDLYNTQGKKSSQLEISWSIPLDKIDRHLISRAVRVQQANRRKPVAATKTRAEVSGGGRKPFRQKGTGRARAGSIRSPLWRGGGVTFGPKPTRNYSLKIPKRMRQKARQMALSDKLSQKKFIVVSNFPIKEIATKKMVEFLEKMPIDEGSILLILGKTNPPVELSAANLPYLKTVQVSGINLLDLLKYDYLLTDKAGFMAISESVQKENP